MQGEAKAKVCLTFGAPDPAPVAPRAESYAYALIKSGPDVNPDDVELGHVTAVEVVILWETTVLHVQHASPPRSFYVGEAEGRKLGCDYFIPSEKLGTTRAPIVLAGLCGLALFEDRNARGLGLATLMAALLVAGTHTPAFGILYSVVPGLSSFHFHGRTAIVLMLTLALAGGLFLSQERVSRRAHRVSVTDAGRKVLEESHRRMVHAFTRALEGWSAAEIAALSEGLERLREDVHRDVADGVKGTLT